MNQIKTTDLYALWRNTSHYVCSLSSCFIIMFFSSPQFFFVKKIGGFGKRGGKWQLIVLIWDGKVIATVMINGGGHFNLSFISRFIFL